MRFLKKNTAVQVTVGPFISKTDGFTVATVTVANTKASMMADTEDNSAPTNILDNVAGNDGTNTLTAISGNDAGYFAYKLTAANVNRDGRVMLSFHDTAAHLPVFHEFMIVPANVFDSLFGSDKLDVNAAEWLGTAVTLSTNNKPDVNVDEWHDVALGTTNPLPNAAAAASGGLIINGNNTGNVELDALSITGQFDAGNLLVDGTTVLTGNVTLSGTLGTGAVTFASHAITGAYSVGTTTTYTGAVSYGSTETHTGNIVQNGATMLSAVTTSIANDAITAAAIANGAIDAGAIAAAALNGKGDWNVGKTGYTLTATTGLGNQTANITGNIVGTVSTVTTLTGHTAQTGDVYALANGANGFVAIYNFVDVLPATWVVPGTLTAGQVRTELATELGRIDVAISSRGTGTSTHSAADVVTAMETNGSKLDVLYDDWANGGRLDLILDTAASAGSLTAASVADAVWDEIAPGHLDAGKAGAQLWTAINAISGSAAINITSTNTVIESE